MAALVLQEDSLLLSDSVGDETCAPALRVAFAFGDIQELLNYAVAALCSFLCLWCFVQKSVGLSVGLIAVPFDHFRRVFYIDREQGFLH